MHALIFTACYSRHMFVWLSFSQTLAAFIAGGEAHTIDRYVILYYSSSTEAA